MDKAKPNRFTLLEQALVIWWEPQVNTWRVMADQCPHRLAPLSEGRINEAGQLECPYHGWAFSGEGRCEHIPQQATTGEAHLSNRAGVKSLSIFLRSYRALLLNLRCAGIATSATTAY